MSTIEERLDALEAHGREIANRLNALAELHKRLCITLGHSRALEVRGLAGGGGSEGSEDGK